MPLLTLIWLLGLLLLLPQSDYFFICLIISVSRGSSAVEPTLSSGAGRGTAGGTEGLAKHVWILDVVTLQLVLPTRLGSM